VADTFLGDKGDEQGGGVYLVENALIPLNDSALVSCNTATQKRAFILSREPFPKPSLRVFWERL
jgi:hypothetical protein